MKKLRAARAKEIKEAILAKTDEIGDCLIYRTRSKKAPQVHPKEAGRPIRVQRMLWICLGRELADDQSVTTRCRNPLCVDPEHLVAVSPSSMARRAAKQRRMSIATRIKASRNSHRRRLTDEQVEAIRTADRTSAELAAEFDVSRSHINRIRSGARRPTNPNTNPWAGLFR